MYGYDPTGIGFQLSIYRMLNSFEKAREIREAAFERQASDYYIDQYNALVRRFNGLANAMYELAPQVEELQQRVQAQERTLQARDARIAELEEQLRDSRATEEDLRQKAWAETLAQIDANRERRRREDQLRSQQT